MAKINDIINIIERFAPPDLACDWDNTGWQINLGNSETSKILLALSPTLNTIDQAVKKGCDLIITHHPLFFSKITRITNANNPCNATIKAIQNNIQIYSAHTNLDKTQNGIADQLASLFQLKNIQKISDFVRIGEFDIPKQLDQVVYDIKKVLKAENIRLINPNQITKITKIAVCPGSGGDFIENLTDVDLYITSDIRYHLALDINNIIVADAGHYETERIILPVIKDLLKDVNVEIFIASELPPWQTI